MKKILPISVLIPTMNRPETLRNTLRSYLEGNTIPSQIVVVDQSNEEARDAVKAECIQYSEITDVKYIYQMQASSTIARNTAFSYAKEEIIIYSDDDVMIYDDTIANLYDIMTQPEIVMIAGLDDNSKEKNGWIGFFLGTRSYRKRNIGHVTGSLLGRFPDSVIGQVDTEWAMGFFFAVKKSLVNRWNVKWDENLIGYAYAEDLDYSYAYYNQAKNEKLRCIYDERIHVKHMTSTEYRIPSRKSTFMYVINRAYLSYKYGMGFGRRISMNWCNSCRLIEKIIKRENPKDMIDALAFLRKNKAEIRNGVFRY